MKSWSIFGCGPAGLYSAWRLLSSGKIAAGDELDLYDWGKYQFDNDTPGTREAAGRICTYHFQKDPSHSYIEVGGMRFIQWDGSDGGAGHRLVSQVVKELNLSDSVVPFGTTEDPLFYLREKNFYSSEISAKNPAPYNADHGLAAKTPTDATNYVADKVLGKDGPGTRKDQCEFYQKGKIPDGFESPAFKPGDPLKNIGYWNLMYDQLGSEGYNYVAAGGGYQSNVINWNSADALIYNSEFAPGGTFKTLDKGYSSLFSALFKAIVSLAKANRVKLAYRPNVRVRSIWLDPNDGDRITFSLAKASAPSKSVKVGTTDYAFLAMPPGSLDILAEGTRYDSSNIVDVLNAEKVALYRDSVLKQPSYKVAMFFHSEWWKDAKYPPRLKNKSDFGPTITDTPLRQIYYFGDNAPVGDLGPPVYGMLASYDDERFVRYWNEMELPVGETRKVPRSEETQPLTGPRKATPQMVNTLRSQLARVHWGKEGKASQVPEPLETVFMDWGQKPFSAGYHAWAAHYDIDDVMQKIRQPTQLIDGHDANLFIVGSAYSNDQAWVEGAFCTSESVLSDILKIDPIISPEDYPFICACPR